jgi:hypothetical protein
LKQLLTDQITANAKDDLEVDPEEDVPIASDAQLRKRTEVQAVTQDSEESRVEPDVEVVEAQGGVQRRVQPTGAEVLPASVETTSTAKVKKTRSKRGRKGRSSEVTEDVVPEREQLSAQDLDQNSSEEDAVVMKEADGGFTLNHIPSRLLHTSAGRRGRRPYKAAGRLGLKVARGRSKSPDVAEAGERASVSTGHGAESTTTLPTTVPTDTPDAAYPTSEPTTVPTSSLKRSARIRDSKGSAVMKSGVLPLIVWS